MKHFIADVLGVRNAKRDLTVYSSDTFIVSFPKSGNTWMRFIVANILFSNYARIDFTNIEKLVPDIYQHRDSVLLRIKHPRILKSHEYFDPRYKRLIYIVRDPRDVVISQYYFLIKNGMIDDDFKVDSFVDLFIEGKTSRFGNWGENIGSWIGARKKDILLIRYEDLKTTTHESINSIANFFDKQLSEKQIQQIVDNTNFRELQKLEKSQWRNWKPIKKSRKDIPFFRSGKSGQWQNVLSNEAVDKIWNKWSDYMKKFEYKMDQ